MEEMQSLNEELRRTQDKLDASRRRYAELYEFAPVAYCTLDPNGVITAVNLAGERLLGFEKKSLINLPLYLFVNKNDLDALNRHYAEVLRTAARRTCEIRLVRKSRVEFYAHLESIARKEGDENAVSIHTAIIDINEHKRDLEVLRCSGARNELILETTISGFWCLDVKGHFVKVNESYCRMSGYSEQELLTMSVDDVEAAETPADTNAHIQKVIAHGGDRFMSVHRRKNGSTFPVEVSATYHPDEGGIVFAFIHDITTRVKAQKAFEESSEKLRLRSRELFEMNSALKVLLKQREQDKQDMEQQVLANVKQFVFPYIEKLKKRKTGDDAAYLGIIEANLREIISMFAKTMSGKFSMLTPQELLVVNLIKEGRQNKDIAEMLHASICTIKAHRRNIRKKLHLTREKTNLRTFLLSA